jgi:N6-adenosine-specific RNA methylase IME4
LLLFGVRGRNARTLAPGRRQVNFIETRKREHSRKPDEQYDLIEACSPGPFIELFARAEQAGLFPRRQQQWVRLGDEVESENPREIYEVASESRERNGGGAP